MSIKQSKTKEKKKKMSINSNFAHKFSSIKLALMFHLAYQQHHNHQAYFNRREREKEKNASKIFCLYMRTGLQNSMEFRCLLLCIVICFCCCCCYCCAATGFIDVVLFSILIMHARAKKNNIHNHSNRKKVPFIVLNTVRSTHTHTHI